MSLHALDAHARRTVRHRAARATAPSTSGRVQRASAPPAGSRRSARRAAARGSSPGDLRPQPARGVERQQRGADRRLVQRRDHPPVAAPFARIAPRVAARRPALPKPPPTKATGTGNSALPLEALDHQHAQRGERVRGVGDDLPRAFVPEPRGIVNDAGEAGQTGPRDRAQGEGASQRRKVGNVEERERRLPEIRLDPVVRRRAWPWRSRSGRSRSAALVAEEVAPSRRRRSGARRPLAVADRPRSGDHDARRARARWRRPARSGHRAIADAGAVSSGSTPCQDPLVAARRR